MLLKIANNWVGLSTDLKALGVWSGKSKLAQSDKDKRYILQYCLSLHCSGQVFNTLMPLLKFQPYLVTFIMGFFPPLKKATFIYQSEQTLAVHFQMQAKHSQRPWGTLDSVLKH